MGRKLISVRPYGDDKWAVEQFDGVVQQFCADLEDFGLRVALTNWFKLVFMRSRYTEWVE